MDCDGDSGLKCMSVDSMTTALKAALRTLAFELERTSPYDEVRAAARTVVDEIDNETLIPEPPDAGRLFARKPKATKKP